MDFMDTIREDLEALRHEYQPISDQGHLYPDYHLQSPILYRDIDIVMNISDEKELMNSSKSLKNIFKLKKHYNAVRADLHRIFFNLLVYDLKSLLIPSDFMNYDTSLTQNLVTHLTKILECKTGYSATKAQSFLQALDGASLYPYHEKLKYLSAVFEWLLKLSNSHCDPTKKLHKDTLSMLEKMNITVVKCKQKIIEGYKIVWKPVYEQNTAPSVEEIYVHTNATVIKSLSTNTIHPKNILIMLQDLLLSRSIIGRILVSYPNDLRFPPMPSYSAVEKFYGMVDQILAVYGNDGFKVVKSLESLIFVKIANRDLRSLCLTDVNPLEQDILNDLLDQYDNKLIDPLNEMLDHSTVNELLEYAGLFRHWGHPIINPSEGLYKMWRIGHTHKWVSPEIMQRLASHCAKILLQGYFRRHRQWPPNVKYHGPHNPLLRKFIAENRWPSQRQQKIIGDCWHYLTHDPLFECPNTVPVLNLLSDKAHSAKRSEIFKVLEMPPYERLKTAVSRRVIITALTSRSINVKEFLTKIDNEGLPLEDLVIGLRAKEREENDAGRFFALMSYNLRSYFVSTEWLLSTFILPLFPSITMTHNMQEMQEKFLTLTDPQQNTDNLATFFIHLDYEKWNWHQRDASTRSVFQVLDRAFGFQNVITRTHEFFEKCYIFYPDCMHLMNKPPTQNVPWDWDGHVGGNEGLRQKGWSIIGDLILSDILRGTNINHQVILQGDNQVIALYFSWKTFPTFDGIRNRENLIKLSYARAKQFLDDLVQYTKELGLIVKPSETWISNSFLLYGKQPIVRGCLKNMILKRAGRMYASSNAIVPTLAESLSCASTTALTITQFCPSIVFPYLLYYWFASRTVSKYMEYDITLNTPLYNVITAINRKCFPQTKWKPKVSREHEMLLLDLITRDTVVGGIGGMSLYKWFMRGFPDPLTLSLCSSMDSYKYTMPSHLSIIHLRQMHPKMEEPKYAQLFDDPTSLPIVGQWSMQKMLKQFARRYLKSLSTHWVVNEDVKTVLDSTLSSRDAVANILIESYPCFPRFLSNLLSISAYGIMEAMLDRVQSTRSFIRLAVAAGSEKFSQRTRAAEKGIISDFLTQHLQENYAPITCVTTHAHNLRCIGWKKELHGVTVPYPAELLELTADDDNSEHLLVRISADAIFDHSQLVKRGPCRPYIGSITKDVKMEGRTASQLDTKEPYSRQVENIIKSINWFVRPGSNMYESVVSLLHSISKEDLSPILNNMIPVGRDPVHRYRAQTIGSGGFATTVFTPATHITMDSTPMKTLGARGKNTNVMFQPLFLYAQQMSIELLFSNLVSGSLMKYRLKCYECIRDTSTFDIELQVPYTHWPDLPERLKLQTGFKILSPKYASQSICNMSDYETGKQDVLLSKRLLVGFSSTPNAYDVFDWKKPSADFDLADMCNGNEQSHFRQITLGLLLYVVHSKLVINKEDRMGAIEAIDRLITHIWETKWNIKHCQYICTQSTLTFIYNKIGILPVRNPLTSADVVKIYQLILTHYALQLIDSKEDYELAHDCVLVEGRDTVPNGLSTYLALLLTTVKSVLHYYHDQELADLVQQCRVFYSVRQMYDATFLQVCGIYHSNVALCDAAWNAETQLEQITLTLPQTLLWSFSEQEPLYEMAEYDIACATMTEYWSSETSYGDLLVEETKQYIEGKIVLILNDGTGYLTNRVAQLKPAMVIPLEASDRESNIPNTCSRVLTIISMLSHPSCVIKPVVLQKQAIGTPRFIELCRSQVSNNNKNLLFLGCLTSTKMKDILKHVFNNIPEAQYHFVDNTNKNCDRFSNLETAKLHYDEIVCNLLPEDPFALTRFIFDFPKIYERLHHPKDCHQLIADLEEYLTSFQLYKYGINMRYIERLTPYHPDFYLIELCLFKLLIRHISKYVDNIQANMRFLIAWSRVPYVTFTLSDNKITLGDENHVFLTSSYDLFNKFARFLLYSQNYFVKYYEDS
nr:TPA_asm: hypothetical protein [Microrhabdovirus]